MEDDLSDDALLNSCLDLPLYSSQWNKLPMTFISGNSTLDQMAPHQLVNLQAQAAVNDEPGGQQCTAVGQNFESSMALPLFEPTTLDFEAIMNLPL